MSHSKFAVSFVLLALVGCNGQVIPVAEETADASPGTPDASPGTPLTPAADAGPGSVSVPGLDAAPPPDADPGPIQFPSWIRIADTYDDPPFDVCFPLVATTSGLPDFTGAKPAIGGEGIITGTTTAYIAVPPNTNAMRFVAAGAADCSVKIGVRTDDSLGAFEAVAGRYYTVEVDQSGYSFDTIKVDLDPDAGPPDDAGRVPEGGPSVDAAGG
jgi:hypothetical protein